MNCGAYSTVAKKTADIRSTVRQAERNSTLRNTSAGTRALSLIRGSIRAKPATSRTATASIAITRASPKPQSAAWSKATSTSSRPVESVTMPG